MIMSSEPLLDLIPIMKREQDGAIITQFDYPTCEKLGLIKMDFLGLRNLTVLDDALINIKANRGETVVLEDLALDDQKTFDLLARGDTLGVFQLDGGPMRALLRSMRPDNFEDISAVGALYRPGPMGANSHNEYADRKNKRKPVMPIHPELAERAGRDPRRHLRSHRLSRAGHGDRAARRRVLARRRRPAAAGDGQEEEIRTGRPVREVLLRHGRARVLAGRGQDAVGHPAAVLRLRLQQGALRGLRDAVLLDGVSQGELPGRVHGRAADQVGDDKDKMAIYLAECRSMGIKVLPPDVNTSVRDFAPVGTDIRFGLSAVRNVGTGVVASIVASRKDKGDYTDFYDFLEKVDQVACNKKVVESLIKAGAFDSLNHPRKGLLMEHARAIDEVLGLKKAEAIGQFDLFGEMSQEEKGDSFRGSVPDTEWDTKLRLGFEREMLGLYVSGHPLAGVEHILSAQSDASIPDILDGTMPDRAMVTVGGILTGLQRRLTKKGDPWASATLEDLAGGVEVAFFPKVYLDCSLLLAEDAIVLVKARVARSEDRLSLHAQQVVVPDLSASADKGPVQVSIAAARCTPPVVDRLRDVLQAHPGTTAVHLKLLNGAPGHHAETGRRAAGDPDVGADG